MIAPNDESEIKALEADQGSYLGYIRLVGRRNTIRKLFAADIERNCIHGSDAPETAAQEIPFFFSASELL